MGSNSRSQWAFLPPELLLHILSFLPGDKHRLKPTVNDLKGNWTSQSTIIIDGKKLVKHVAQPQYFRDDYGDTVERNDLAEIVSEDLSEDVSEEEQEMLEMSDDEEDRVMLELDNRIANFIEQRAARTSSRTTLVPVQAVIEQGIAAEGQPSPDDDDEPEPDDTQGDFDDVDILAGQESETEGLLQDEGYPSSDNWSEEDDAVHPSHPAEETRNSMTMLAGTVTFPGKDRINRLLRTRRQYRNCRAVCRDWQSVLDRAPFWREFEIFAPATMQISTDYLEKMTPLQWSDTIMQKYCLVCLANRGTREKTIPSVQCIVSTPYYGDFRACARCVEQIGQHQTCLVCLKAGYWVTKVDWPIGSQLPSKGANVLRIPAHLPSAWHNRPGGPKTRGIPACDDCKSSLFYEIVDLIRLRELACGLQFASQVPWEIGLDNLYDHYKYELQQRLKSQVELPCFDFAYHFETIRWLNTFPTYQRDCWIATAIDSTIVPTEHFKKSFVPCKRSKHKSTPARGLDRILEAQTVEEVMEILAFSGGLQDPGSFYNIDMQSSSDEATYGHGNMISSFVWGQYMTLNKFAFDTLRQGRWGKMSELCQRMSRSLQIGLGRTAKNFMARVPPSYLWPEIDRHIENMILQTFGNEIKSFVEQVGNQFDLMSADDLVLRLMSALKESQEAVEERPKKEIRSTISPLKPAVSKVAVSSTDEDDDWVTPERPGSAPVAGGSTSENWANEPTPGAGISDKQAGPSEKVADNFDIPDVIDLNEYGWGLGRQRSVWLNNLCRSSRKKRPR